MAETSNDQGANDSQAVSIAGGSLFLIGLMLWFFTSGIRNEVKLLREETREVKELLKAQSEALRLLTARVGSDKVAE